MFKTLSTITVLGLLTLSTVRAQSEQPIQAKVPFAFNVGNTSLAAGSYKLTYSNTAHILSIQGLEQNSKAAFATALLGDVSDFSNRSGRVVFECYGKTCYLAQLWQGAIGGGRGLKIGPTKEQHALSFSTRVVSISIPTK